MQEMTDRARRVRELFAEADAAEGRERWTTEQIMLGLVGDVGDLAKLVLGKSGVRPRADLGGALSHELADCLWSLLVIADEYGVDLEAAFAQLSDDLESSLEKKLPTTD